MMLRALVSAKKGSRHVGGFQVLWEETPYGVLYALPPIKTKGCDEAHRPNTRSGSV
jgi:hypothetical protein